MSREKMCTQNLVTEEDQERDKEYTNYINERSLRELGYAFAKDHAKITQVHEYRDMLLGIICLEKKLSKKEQRKQGLSYMGLVTTFELC